MREGGREGGKGRGKREKKRVEKYTKMREGVGLYCIKDKEGHMEKQRKERHKNFLSY